MLAALVIVTIVFFSCQSTSNAQVNVSLGNGCFWARQHAFVMSELAENGPFNRSYATVTSLVGYQGATHLDHTGAVCYRSNNPVNYVTLGYAEVVQITLQDGSQHNTDSDTIKNQFKYILSNFFASYIYCPQLYAMVRPDPWVCVCVCVYVCVCVCVCVDI